MTDGIKKPAADEWTISTYAAYQEALRHAEEKFEAERDRRYAEVNLEREKALKIKEEADKRALELAREIQTYKDEKANDLREQINSERGLYVTQSEMKPVTDYIAGVQGRDKGIGTSVGVIAFLVSTGIAAGGLIGYLLS